MKLITTSYPTLRIHLDGHVTYSSVPACPGLPCVRVKENDSPTDLA